MGGGSLLSGFTSGHKKLTLISGGRYFRGVGTIGTLREYNCGGNFLQIVVYSNVVYAQSYEVLTLNNCIEPP